jgi:transcriptional regulator with XRE-family HTH domain
MESIGRRIRNERERQGLTQDELARKMGYKNRSVVSTMEAATELSLKKVKKVATALNVDPGYLMGYPSKNADMETPFDADLKKAFEKLIAESYVKQILSDTEIAIIKRYRELNDDQKQMILKMLDLK